MKTLPRFLAIIALTGLLIIPSGSAEAAQSLKGRWRVTTRLVAAQNSINPTYTPGDIRKENWRISGGKRKARLKSPAGRIGGRAVGKAWRFKQNFDTGLGIIIGMDIVARRRGASRMTGTIKAQYFSTQFGHLLGIDAWSFKARKR